MDQHEIDEILKNHRSWVRREGGKRADLSGANLQGADLRAANLLGANLRAADLHAANLHSANLFTANLHEANLRGADLRSADLRWANLVGANLIGTAFHEADIHNAKISFCKLPSIKTLSSFDLGELSDKLTLELMRRDAWAHPHPELFDEWAKDGNCPYRNEERFWMFRVKPQLWRRGKPRMRDSNLILAICKEKGWKIDGY